MKPSDRIEIVWTTLNDEKRKNYLFSADLIENSSQSKLFALVRGSYVVPKLEQNLSLLMSSAICCCAKRRN